MAEKVGGKHTHHFKFLQAPYNRTNEELDMLHEQIVEGKTEKVSVIEACKELGINILATNVYQSRLRFHNEKYDSPKNMVAKDL